MAAKSARAAIAGSTARTSPGLSEWFGSHSHPRGHLHGLQHRKLQLSIMQYPVASPQASPWRARGPGTNFL